jgi:hypothetical protein
MTEPSTTPIALHPRCDGRRLLFEIMDDGRSVACAISLMALEDLSERRCYKPADQLKSFAQARRQIEAIALNKIRMKPADSSDLLTIWSDDVDDMLPNPA